MRSILVLAALAALPLSAAVAQDQIGFKAIAKADYSGAEALLAPKVAAGDRAPEVLLNLAAVYTRTGRNADAARIYRMVQGTENVLMEAANGAPVWSHDLATRGLMLAQR